MKHTSRVVVIDDDGDSLRSVTAALRADGFDVSPFTDAAAGLDHVREQGADVVVTDLRMPAMGGMEVLRRVAGEGAGIPVVVLTAFGTVESAVEAVRAGASDYLMKPVEIPRLRAAVFKAAKERSLRREIALLREQVGAARGLDRIVGSSRAMEEVVRRIRLVAPTRMNVLVQGESGTGKELVARAIHDLSPRADRPFLPINCAAIPETLLESELFGYERGAFTGAVASRQGKMEAAEGGTLFLDEVGEVPLAVQAKLLRAIEEKEVMRVGGSHVVRVDVRIVAATNRELAARVAEKAFREDLYYRLNVFTITVPPLRERREDIPRLSAHFLAEIAREGGGEAKRLSTEAARALLSCRWPGNVRQLRNALEAAALVSAGEEIRPEDFPPDLFVPPPAAPAAAIPLPGPSAPPSPGGTLGEAEAAAIRAALARTGGNRSEAAALLGTSLRTLYRRLKEYGIG